MFQNETMMERRTGVIKITDVSVETIDNFLNFLYCGKLKVQEPSWVTILPELVYIAHKVSSVICEFVKVICILPLTESIDFHSYQLSLFAV